MGLVGVDSSATNERCREQDADEHPGEQQVHGPSKEQRWKAMGFGRDYPNPLHTGERLRALARAFALVFTNRIVNGSARSARAEDEL